MKPKKSNIFMLGVPKELGERETLNFGYIFHRESKNKKSEKDFLVEGKNPHA